MANAGCLPDWPRPPFESLCWKPKCLRSDQIEVLYEANWQCAVSVIHHLACCRFPGCKPTEVRPCLPCGCLPGSCRCGAPTTLDLSGWKRCGGICCDADGVPAIDIVKDGNLWGIPSASNIPSEGKRLFRMEGDLLVFENCGGKCGDNQLLLPSQDLSCPNGSAGTWSIRALTGGCPPPLLLKAAGDLAVELMKDCDEQGSSCLPSGVTSITRRSLSMEVGPQLAETIRFDTGSIGIATADMVKMMYRCESEDSWFGFDPCATSDPNQIVWHPVTPAAAPSIEAACGVV